MLHEEIGRLPDRYRTPVVLCYLEGLTHEEAVARARMAHWNRGCALDASPPSVCEPG